MEKEAIEKSSRREKVERRKVPKLRDISLEYKKQERRDPPQVPNHKFSDETAKKYKLDSISFTHKPKKNKKKV